MIDPVQLSIDPSLSPAAFAAEEAAGKVTSIYSQPQAVEVSQTVPIDIQDTVTLSTQALQSSSRATSRLFAVPSDGGYRSEIKEHAALLQEFPVQELLEEGYSSSEIAINLGLPPEAVSVDLGLQRLNTAA